MATTMYCPESPAHSECAYVPESPARSECVYEPESPMKRGGTGTGLIARLLGDMQKTHSSRPPPKYTRICGWRNYIKLMILEEKKKIRETKELTEKVPYSQKFKQDYIFRLAQYEKIKLQMVEVAWNERKFEERKQMLKAFIKEWRDACPTPRKVANKPLDKNIDYFNKVVTKMKVDKSGHVHVNISTPLANIHKKYLQNLLKPPIDEYAQVLRDVGYPEWIIKRMYKRHKEVDEPVKTVQESFESKDFKKSKSKKPVSTLNKFKSKQPS